MAEPIPRLLPDEPLPPYAYVTGRFPHPTTNPAGHSFGHSPPPPAALDPEHPRASRDWLLACDLFNHGYYWEAHEHWEGLWHAAGRRGPTAEVLQGLIKLAAAGVKAREGRPAGVVRHARRAAELFSRAAAELPGSPRYLGLNLDELAAIAEQLAASPPAFVSSGAAVEVIFDFKLKIAP